MNDHRTDVAGAYFDAKIAATYGPVPADHLAAQRARYIRDVAASEGAQRDLAEWDAEGRP